MPGLTVTRKSGERVRIGEGERAVWVTLVQTRGPGSAVLNFDGPREVLVLREENVPETER